MVTEKCYTPGPAPFSRSYPRLPDRKVLDARFWPSLWPDKADKNEGNRKRGGRQSNDKTITKDLFVQRQRQEQAKNIQPSHQSIAVAPTFDGVDKNCRNLVDKKFEKKFNKICIMFRKTSAFTPTLCCYFSILFSLLFVYFFFNFSWPWFYFPAIFDV